MRSRVLLLGIAVAAVLSVTTTIAVALEWWTLAAAAAALLLSSGILVAADTNRQVRMVRRQLLKVGRRVDQVRATAVETPPVDLETPVEETRADMLGAVRVLQAQYTARLDRLQAAVDEAVTELRHESDQGAGEPTPR